jgi:hypothetical protein
MAVIMIVPFARRGAVVIGLSLTIAVAACGSASQPRSDPSGHPSPRSPSATTSLEALAADRQAVLAAYLGMWQAYETAAAVPDPGSRDLARYSTGEALRTLVNGIQSLKDQGLKGTGTVSHTPQITQVSPIVKPTDMSISDCMETSASHIVRATPGSPYNDSPGGRRLTLADVRKQDDGSWKVDSFGVRAVGTC